MTNRVWFTRLDVKRSAVIWDTQYHSSFYLENTKYKKNPTNVPYILVKRKIKFKYYLLSFVVKKMIFQYGISNLLVRFKNPKNHSYLVHSASWMRLFSGIDRSDTLNYFLERSNYYGGIKSQRSLLFKEHTGRSRYFR